MDADIKNWQTGDIVKMQDTEFLNLLRKYPYQQMWQADVWQYAQIRLARIQGTKYISTGSLHSFKATQLR